LKKKKENGGVLISRYKRASQDQGFTLLQILSSGRIEIVKVSQRWLNTEIFLCIVSPKR
jgi:hypothetical protein